MKLNLRLTGPSTVSATVHIWYKISVVHFKWTWDSVFRQSGECCWKRFSPLTNHCHSSDHCKTAVVSKGDLLMKNELVHDVKRAFSSFQHIDGLQGSYTSRWHCVVLNNEDIQICQHMSLQDGQAKVTAMRNL